MIQVLYRLKLNKGSLLGCTEAQQESIFLAAPFIACTVYTAFRSRYRNKS